MKWRWAVVVLLTICAGSLVSLVGRGCAEDQRREEAQMRAQTRAIYRDLGDGDELLGEVRYRREVGFE